VQSKKGLHNLVRRSLGVGGVRPFFVAPLTVALSNQFHEDIKLLYDLSLFMDAHKNDQMYNKSQAS